MKRLTAAHVLAGSFGLVASQDYNAPPPNLTTLPALSLFETWRPHIHVLPASGHIGDPCAHYVDPDTGLFHVGFLHNNTGISSVYTDDLVHLFYTSVTSLPIHWTIPYVWGSESQSLAVTSNGGKNFTKLDRTPVIPGPPRADVTGFRDPYVFQNGHLDKALNSSEDTWYAVISGGVRDVGPGIFLYRSISDDFQDWEYMGNWFNASVNSTLGNGPWPRVSGYNWETANVFSLDRTGYNQNADTFMTFGVEGSYVPIRKSVTSMHEMLWASGHISAQDSNASFSADMIGVLDWGLSAYAAAGKVVPSTARVSQHGVPDRFISYVWLNGDGFEQIKGFPTAQQGWNNTLLLPRELRMLPISNVVYNELAQETGSWRVASDQNPAPGSCTELETLGIDIARETYRAMTSVDGFSEPDRTITNQDREIIPFGTSPDAKFFVLEAQITFPQSARQSGVQAGFQVLASELESTTIYYQFSNESIVIDRSNTSAAAKTTPGIDESLESGHLRLFDISDCCGGEGDGHTQCDSHVETLDLTIVVDNSVLEVYANSRFVMSTWARSWYANSTEIRFFHSGAGEVSFSNIHVREGLYDAYPGRTR